MNPQVSIDSQSIKGSLKRNSLGQAIIASALLVVVYVAFQGCYIGIGFAFGIICGYILLQVLCNYFISVSVIIDKGILAMFKRRSR